MVVLGESSLVDEILLDFLSILGLLATGFLPIDSSTFKLPFFPLLGMGLFGAVSPFLLSGFVAPTPFLTGLGDLSDLILDASKNCLVLEPFPGLDSFASSVSSFFLTVRTTGPFLAGPGDLSARDLAVASGLLKGLTELLLLELREATEGEGLRGRVLQF